MGEDALLQFPGQLKFALQPFLLNQSGLGLLQFMVKPGSNLGFLRRRSSIICISALRSRALSS